MGLLVFGGVVDGQAAGAAIGAGDRAKPAGIGWDETGGTAAHEGLSRPA